MVVLGPLSREIDLEVWDHLLPEDKEWLELMCDVLPPHWPVNGTERGLMYGLDPRLMSETIR